MRRALIQRLRVLMGEEWAESNGADIGQRERWLSLAR